MSALMYRTPFEGFLNVQREMDRLFDRIWGELPAYTSNTTTGFSVSRGDDEWRVDVPLPGVDPDQVTLEVVGNIVSIRAGQSGNDTTLAYERSFTVPGFLDVSHISASHRHGMLYLTIPVRDEVKPRRVPIETAKEQQRLEAALS